MSLVLVVRLEAECLTGAQLDEKDRAFSEQKRELIELRHRLEQTKRLYEASKLLLEHQSDSPPPLPQAAFPTLAHRTTTTASAAAASSTTTAAASAAASIEECERLRTQLSQVRDLSTIPCTLI